jgi:hypothetical protein
MRNRRLFARVLIAATAAFGIAAPVAGAAPKKKAPGDVQGAPDPVIQLHVKSRNHTAKVTWDKPFGGGTVDHYEIRLFTPGTLNRTLVDSASTTKVSETVELPKDWPASRGDQFLVEVVAVGNDGTAKDPIWQVSAVKSDYATLKFKK